MYIPQTGRVCVKHASPCCATQWASAGTGQAENGSHLSCGLPDSCLTLSSLSTNIIGGKWMKKITKILLHLLYILLKCSQVVQYFSILLSSKNNNLKAPKTNTILQFHPILLPNILYYQNVNFWIYMTLSLTLKRMLKMQAKDQKRKEKKEREKSTAGFVCMQKF